MANIPGYEAVAKLVRQAAQPVGGFLPLGPAAAGLGVRQLGATCGAEPADYSGRHSSRDHWILVATLAGAGTLDTGSRQLTVGPGQVFVVPPGHSFWERSTGGCAWTWACIRVALVPDSPVFAPARPEVLVFEPGLAYVQLMTDLANVLFRRNPGFELVALARLLELFALTNRRLDGHSEVNASSFVAKAMELMRTKLAQKLAVAELAQACFMSKSAFAHRFKQEVGVSPLHWLTQERIRLAKHLLMDGRKLADVASLTGFQNPFHFSRVFTKAEGVPPGRFRKLSRRG